MAGFGYLCTELGIDLITLKYTRYAGEKNYNTLC